MHRWWKSSKVEIQGFLYLRFLLGMKSRRQWAKTRQRSTTSTRYHFMSSSRGLCLIFLTDRFFSPTSFTLGILKTFPLDEILESLWVSSAFSEESKNIIGPCWITDASISLTDMASSNIIYYNSIILSSSVSTLKHQRARCNDRYGLISSGRALRLTYALLCSANKPRKQCIVPLLLLTWHAEKWKRKHRY